GEQTRDFVYVGDVVRANLAAIHHDISDCAVNISTTVETSVNALFKYLAEIINPGMKSIFAPPRQGEQQRSVLDNASARKQLDWEPVTPLTEGLKKTFEYFKTLLES
ncbi:MAG: GDP-mannose 4,6-dehydratase, partial [Nitrospirota bacterium]